MKKIMYLGIIIFVIVIICICVLSSSDNNKNVNNTINNETKLNKEENNNNESNKKVNEEIVNETENEITNETENIVSSETFEESPKTSEEKAIDIVKKDWQENSDAEFSVEGIDGNGNYIVAVRDSKTTEALAFYTVNVTSQTFTKREMN